VSAPREIELEFAGRAARLSAAGIAAACAILGIGEAEMRAVLAVESLGSGFLADGRPKILFERHWFHRLTGGRFSAGGIRTPGSRDRTRPQGGARQRLLGPGPDHGLQRRQGRFC
jgi:hypothetical protein